MSSAPSDVPAGDRLTRSQYPYVHPLGTRWSDNDVYGHVNNVAYYSYFDTAVNSFLIGKGVLNIQDGTVIGLVVETACQYFAPLSFPEPLTVGVGAAHIGNSSVRYRLGVFRQGEDSPAAQGQFVHVYVDRATRRPVALPAGLRALLESIRLL